MFTGIVQSTGAVTRHHDDVLHVDIEDLRTATSGAVELGESIAVDGVDLTVSALRGASAVFIVMPETSKRSTLGALVTGDLVHLERSLTPASRISGHLVRGVVEGTAELLDNAADGRARLLRFKVDPTLRRHMVVKGPVAVAGVSLTITDTTARTFTVSLVHHTITHTLLARREPGERVNVETDLLSRYVANAVRAGTEDGAGAVPGSSAGTAG